MVLAKALQHCAEQLGLLLVQCVMQSETCKDACLALLIQLDEEDIWEASLLESVEDESVASPMPAEEALLLAEDPEPQGTQASAPCKPVQPEEALKPEVTARTADSLDIQQPLPSPP